MEQRIAKEISMGWFSKLCAVCLLVTLPMAAHANGESCADTLLEAPVKELIQELRLSDQQVAQVLTIRSDTCHRRGELRRRLGEVQAEQARVGPWAAPELEQEGVTLLDQLEAEPARTLDRIQRVLAPWQLGRCSGESHRWSDPALPDVRRAPPAVLRRVPQDTSHGHRT
jgi:hypothetical protein